MVALSLGLMLIAPAAFTGAGSGCREIPKAAQEALHRSLQSLLEPHAKTLTDWDGQSVRVEGPLSCRDAVAADFDGRGAQDIVALFTAGKAPDRALLLSAFHLADGWRGSIMEFLPLVDHVSLLPAGEYRRNPALVRKLRPGEKAVVTSRLPGVGITIAPGACLVFFLGDHRWVFTETACE